MTALLGNHGLPPGAHLLRQLPVHFRLAPHQVIQAVATLHPAAVICCGMAEKRQHLTVESNGTFQGETLYTAVDLESLVQPLLHTTISHNAGRFVCNYLYYRVLKYLRPQDLATPCIFVHVPLLTVANRNEIVQDFTQLLQAVYWNSTSKSNR